MVSRLDQPESQGENHRQFRPGQHIQRWIDGLRPHVLEEDVDAQPPETSRLLQQRMPDRLYGYSGESAAVVRLTDRFERCQCPSHLPDSRREPQTGRSSEPQRRLMSHKGPCIRPMQSTDRAGRRAGCLPRLQAIQSVHRRSDDSIHGIAPVPSPEDSPRAGRNSCQSRSCSGYPDRCRRRAQSPACVRLPDRHLGRAIRRMPKATLRPARRVPRTHSGKCFPSIRIQAASRIVGRARTADRRRGSSLPGQEGVGPVPGANHSIFG